jgi:hypothetical protein
MAVGRRAKQSPKVAAAIRNQRGKVVDRAELKLFEAMEREQAWAIAMILKTIGEDRGYVERVEQQTLEEIEARIDEEPRRLGAGGQVGDLAEASGDACTGSG